MTKLSHPTVEQFSRREILKAGAAGIALAGLPRWYADELLAHWRRMGADVQVAPDAGPASGEPMGTVTMPATLKNPNRLSTPSSS